VKVETEVTTKFIGAESLLYQVDHRPWMPPSGPWVMTQTWNDLAFFHYAIEPSVLRALVPPALTLDLYQGSAWFTVLPFWMNHIRPPGIPSLPVLSTMPELNVRTYVTYRGKPGIYFFSLDAGNLSAVWAARVFYRLPYWHAAMKVVRDRDVRKQANTPVSPTSPIHYSSKRIHGPAANHGPAEFQGSYHPKGVARHARVRSLDEFLIERYCLYAVSKNAIYRGEVHHLPYLLQLCEYDIHTNTMAEPIGLKLPQNPDLAHYSSGLKVLIWPPEKLK
jgi:uncharacterized protein